MAQPFSNANTIANSGENPSEIQLTDVDADNDLDVIAVFPSELVWIENLAPNNFSTQTIASSVNPVKLISEDVNADGFPDVIYSDSNNKVSWFQNLGNGSFSTEMIIDNAILAPSAIQSADLDGDGLEDLAVISDTSEIGWYKNLGNGIWGARTAITTINANHIALGDLDHDGDADLLTEDGENIVWLKNNGSGIFSTPIILFANAIRIKGVFIKDVSGDDKMDLVFLSDYNARYRVSLGNGLFDTPGHLYYNVRDHDLLAVEDIDGNGIKNILLVNNQNPEQILNFPYRYYSSYPKIFANIPQINDLKIGDLDNDGDMDIVTCGSNKVIWLSNLRPIDKDGDGFLSPADCNDHNADVYPGAPEICDGLDNDCDGIFNEQAPELIPQVFTLPNSIYGYSKFEVVMRVVNTGNLPTDGTKIQAQIPSDPRWTFTWNQGLQTAAMRSVQNADWSYIGDSGIMHLFEYNPTTPIPPYGSISFGLEAMYDPQNTDGQTTIGLRLPLFTGGGCSEIWKIGRSTLVYFE